MLFVVIVNILSGHVVTHVVMLFRVRRMYGDLHFRHVWEVWHLSQFGVWHCLHWRGVVVRSLKYPLGHSW